MKKIPGVVSAVVIDREDPDGLGRVKLKFSWLAEGEPESSWARIAVPMAGAERGAWFMPEVDDEVLVAFEYGDLRKPYVVGFLWNGVDKPPVKEPERRVITTVAGHVLEFDDTEGSERIALAFKGEVPSITIDEQAIEIKFSDSSFIKLTAADLTIANDTLVAVNP